MKRKFEQFCYRNQDKGIRNLMLYVAIGNLIVYFLTVIDPSKTIYSLLYFDRTKILHGQLWRLVSYVFTMINDSGSVNTLLSFVTLFCYYQIGQMLENQWGVLRFNLYYLCGVVLMDLGGLLLGGGASCYYLNLTLFLAIATILPDLQFLLFFIIPVKAKYFAWVYFGLTALSLIQGVLAMLRMLSAGIVYLAWVFPLIALANYFLFFGKDVSNVLPDFLRYRKPKKPKFTQSQTKTYRHKCTVCGRTDAQYPNLEFRYCSKCRGYYCYCQEHIGNHVHIV